MSDVTAAPEQDAIAESLLGDEVQEQVAEQEPVAEQQLEPETESQVAEQDEQQTEETVEDWLPSEQDKTFSEDALLRYAQRYQKDEQWLSDPLNRQILVDKLNSDIFIRRQQQLAEQETEEQEVAEPTPEAPLNREQHFANLSRVIAERTDPEVAKAFHGEFLKVWNLPPEQQPMAFTQMASKYMLNLMTTFMPDLFQSQLQQQIGQAYPEFGAMYERSAHAMAWDRVRNSDPQFAGLPSYGTKEFSSKLREASSRIPGFDEMQFTDGQGRPLPAQQNAERKYAMLAKIASGQSVDPQLVQRAAAAGAKNARRAEVRRSAGNLGSGQSKAASGTSKGSRFQTNSDLFDDDAMDMYQQQHGRL